MTDRSMNQASYLFTRCMIILNNRETDGHMNYRIDTNRLEDFFNKTFIYLSYSS